MPPANTPALLAAPGTGVKVVPTNHNVPLEDYTSPERWDPNPLDRKMRLEALDHAARIHVIFPRFGDWFPDHLRSRIVAMPNYVSKEILRASPEAVREPSILAVGRLAGVKNYDTLLAAWALIAKDHPDVEGGGLRRRAATQESQGRRQATRRRGVLSPSRAPRQSRRGIRADVDLLPSGLFRGLRPLAGGGARPQDAGGCFLAIAQG